MISLSVCPVCSGQSFRDFLICKDYTTSGEDFYLKKCNFCEFVLTDPSPDQNSIGRYYQSDKYISHTGGKRNIFDIIYLIIRSFALKKKRKWIENYSQGSSILDLGCGTGEFLKEMKNNHWQTFGVEPSAAAREKATKTSNTQIYSSLLEIQDAKFDVITLWHVLEHLHDLNGSLQKINSLLKESGTVFIAVPNLKSHDADYYGSHWAAYDVPRHLWHFSRENIKQILEKNGLMLQTILPMKMDSYYVSLLSESYKNSGGSKVRNALNATIRGFVSNRKAKQTGNYSSLIYIAKR